MRATSSATASISPPVSKPWPIRAGSASAASCATRCATSSTSPSRTWASSRSRTSLGLCTSTALFWEEVWVLPGYRRRRRHNRCCAARQAVDRGSAVPEYERRSGAGIFRRWHGRGDHHRAVAHPLALRHRPQFELYLQRASGRCEAGRARAWRPLCARRLGAQRLATGCALPAS